jgi:CheY-like chemotaxis protein
VESQPGEGTTFTFYLPLIQEVSKENIETKRNLPTGSEKILVVDDEPNIINLYSSMLEMLGYRVVVVSNALAALEIFRKEAASFDLVMTDMTMPKLTGDKLTQEIRKVRPEIPVILCTGFSEKLDTNLLTTLEINAFLEKPLTMADMAQKIRQVLDQQPLKKGG